MASAACAQVVKAARAQAEAAAQGATLRGLTTYELDMLLAKARGPAIAA